MTTPTLDPYGGANLPLGASSSITSYFGGSPINIARSLSNVCDVRDYGVVDDASAAVVDTNTERLISAISACAGKCRLYIPKNITIVTNPMVWTGDYSDILIGGVIKLCNGAAADTSVRANLIDLQMSNFRMEFLPGAYLDGNRSNQSWSAGQVVGGLTSNTYSTTKTWVVDPGASSATPITNGLIISPVIKNVGNWPVSLGYCSNIHIIRGTFSDSGNSPQFFSGSSDCTISDSVSRNITDAGFSFYVGNTRNRVIRHLVDSCNQGLGGYVEDDTRAAVVDCGVEDSTIINCANGAIGFTTGGTVTTPKMVGCYASRNTCINNGTSSTNTRAIIGVVGAQDVTIVNNTIDGGCSTQSTTPYGIYIAGSVDGAVVTGNVVRSFGASANKSVGVVSDGAKNTLIANNLVSDREGYIATAYSGTSADGTVMGTNYTTNFSGTANNFK